MNALDEHRRLERALADALTAADPVAALRAAAESGGWSDAIRTALAGAEADGVRITGLLVAKLRFERLMNGSKEASAWFERDGRGFTDAFRRYHGTVPPTASEPRGEAALFVRWLAADGGSAASADALAKPAEPPRA